MDNRPIGVFDSGVGGVSVLRTLLELMPNEEYIYLGDTEKVPYGTKSKDEIVRYSLDCAEFLKSNNVKMTIVACNTASNNAGLELIEKYENIKLVDLIKPILNIEAEEDEICHIGIIATEATINNSHFRNSLVEPEDRGKVKLFKKAGPKFVELVEQNEINTDKADTIIEEYMAPLLKENIDVLVLGCTHYQFLKTKLELFAPNLKIVDPSEWAANEVHKEITHYGMETNKTNANNVSFYVTTQSPQFRQLASSLLGFECEEPKIVKIH
ncbi:glutamate racemase [bacterium]|nr:MAG: glutamate racemase [bacterium]